MSESNEQHHDDARLELSLRRHFRSELGPHVGASARRFTAMIEASAASAALGASAESSACVDDRVSVMRIAAAATSGRPSPNARAQTKPAARAWYSSFWSIGVTGAAMAALLTIVTMRDTIAPVSPASSSGVASSSGGASPVSGSSPPAPAPAVLRNVAWDTEDKGLVQLDDGTLARRLVQRGTDTLKWYDRKRDRHIEYTVPREETVFVSYQPH